MYQSDSKGCLVFGACLALALVLKSVTSDASPSIYPLPAGWDGPSSALSADTSASQFADADRVVQLRIYMGDMTRITSWFYRSDQIIGVTQKNFQTNNNAVVPLSSAVNVASAVLSPITRCSFTSSSTPLNTVETCSLQPSILGARSQEYTLGERFIKIGLACVDWNGVNFVFWPFSFGTSLGPVGTFGGHDATHSGLKPFLRAAWSGTNATTAGQNIPPVTTQSANLTVVGTASDSQRMYNAGEDLLTIYLPEVAEEALMGANFSCTQQTPPPRTVTWIWNLTFHMAMDVPLQPVNNLVSANRLSTLTIQRAGNSHATSAGYATATNAVKLQSLVNNYGACPTHKSSGTYPLSSQALSLRNGGLYDINLDWKLPHQNHRSGLDVDIGVSALNQAEKNCLYFAYNSLYLSPVSGENMTLTKGNAIASGDHVHLISSAESDKYPLDQTPDGLYQ